MASANPVGDVESGERDDRPTLTEQHSPRGDRLASEDPSTPGPDRRRNYTIVLHGTISKIISLA